MGTRDEFSRMKSMARLRYCPSATDGSLSTVGPAKVTQPNSAYPRSSPWYVGVQFPEYRAVPMLVESSTGRAKRVELYAAHGTMAAMHAMPAPADHASRRRHVTVDENRIRGATSRPPTARIS